MFSAHLRELGRGRLTDSPHHKKSNKPYNKNKNKKNKKIKTKTKAKKKLS